MTPKKQRQKYAPEFKAETLKLAEKVSVAAAAKELGLKESQIYAWRPAAAKKASVSDREAALQTEAARLKRQLGVQAEELAIVKKAAYFAKWVLHMEEGADGAKLSIQLAATT